MSKLNLNDIKHPIYAFAIVAFVGLALHGGASWKNIVCALIGSATAEVAIFAKEFYDKVIKRKFFDWKDIRIAQIGVVLGFICVWLFM